MRLPYVTFSNILNDSDDAKAWFTAIHVKAEKILSDLRSFAAESDRLSATADALCQLYMQGSQRLLDTFQWSEFVDIRKFFDAFFARLRLELDHLAQLAGQCRGTPEFEAYQRMIFTGVNI